MKPAAGMKIDSTADSAAATGGTDSDLFASAGPKTASYSAKDIEVLEGLEPVRLRPVMYSGGTQ